MDCAGEERALGTSPEPGQALAGLTREGAWLLTLQPWDGQCSLVVYLRVCRRLPLTHGI